MLLLNATSLRKPTALQHLATELRQTNSDFGFIVETLFKSVDNDGLFSIADYILFTRHRVCVVVDVSTAVVYAFTLNLVLTGLLCLHAPQPIRTLRFCGFIHVSVVMSTFLFSVI